MGEDRLKDLLISVSTKAYVDVNYDKAVEEFG
jgi:hypothetical protein